jgi:beta-lactamase class A
MHDVMHGVINHWRKPLAWSGCGVLAGILLTSLYIIEQKRLQENCAKEFQFTNQSLGCAEYEESISSMKSLDQELNDATKRYVKDGRATSVSVWVRDLKTRQWAASNEFERYTPASLMKVPIMITYYKLAEIEPTILEKKIPYVRANKPDAGQYFPPQSQLIPGKSYTVEELIEQMIINSDNDARAILSDYVEPKLVNNTRVDLGIEIPLDPNSVDFTTVKTYANIFRILYNASYLRRDFSEKALSLMSKTTFKGIREPLPASVSVSDKFGEREVVITDGTLVMRELHDCGIVYKKSHPYSICIMTKGENFDGLLSVIRELSELTYEKF